jgi:hypothetical protein
MFGVLGVEAPDEKEILAEMRRWGMDGALVRFAEEIASIRLDERESAGGWHEDARSLLAGFAIVVEVATATLDAIGRIEQRESFLWEDGPIDATDALFLEAWAPIGQVLRYDPSGADKDRWRKLLEEQRNREG